MASTLSKMLDFVLRSLHVKNSFDKIFNSRKFGKGDVNDPPKFLYTTLDIEKVQTRMGNNFILKPKSLVKLCEANNVNEVIEKDANKNKNNRDININVNTDTDTNINSNANMDADSNKDLDTSLNKDLHTSPNTDPDLDSNLDTDNNIDIFNRICAKHILYLHGGGYIHGFNSIHWLFLKTLTQELNCTIIAPDYPVAPEFTYHESFEMVIPIYKQLISTAGKENVILMGDSSGGGFALALAQKMHEQDIEMASQIILISPWLDITLKNKDIKAIDSEDPILGVNGLRRAGLAYAGETNPDNYLLSPINGPVEGLGKISIFVGTKDILVADTRKFKIMTQEKGIAINYFEYEDMLHVWPLFSLPESKLAIEQIKNLVNSEE